MPDYCRALLGDSRPKSGDVGVGWGQEWDQKSSSIARAASSRISSRTWAYLLRSSRGRPGRASGRPCGAGRLGARPGCRRCDAGRGSGCLPGGQPPQGTAGEPPEGAHHGVAPAEPASRLREDQARVGPAQVGLAQVGPAQVAPPRPTTTRFLAISPDSYKNCRTLCLRSLSSLGSTVNVRARATALKLSPGRALYNDGRSLLGISMSDIWSR
jgi:hypothetical protein